MIRKDGSICDVLINSSAYFQNGKFVHTSCFTRDITEQLQAEKELRRFAAIVESTDDVIIAKDLNGTITNWNGAAERLYGYSADEMIGKPISILIPPDRKDEGANILKKLRAGERIDHYESVRVAKDGRRIDVSLTVSPIRDANGKVVGASKIARDITDKKRSQIERERMLEREEKARTAAEAANRIKDEFLATLSHELRTPLNAILGWASMLRGKKLDPQESAHAIEIIDRNAKVQSQLIESVLDVSRIVSGKFHIECRPVPLHEALSAAVDSIRPSAAARNIQLQLKTNSNVVLVAGDLSRLQQIIWNLLSNAVKFTEPGGQVVVDLETVGPDVELIVRDSGQGISADFLPHVFDRFRQADSSTTRRHGGLGLGLAIVRHLTELHGGTVTAESEGEGKGATFRVRLPSIAADVAGSFEPQKQQRDGGPNPASLLRGLKVLVVEDEIDARELLVEMLSRCKAVVKSAGSAQEALKLVTEWLPDVLVSDISMPEVDGYTFIQRVREMTSNGGIPAIAVTAHARDKDQEHALDAGFHGYLTKPIELYDLAICIARVTGKLPSEGLGNGNGDVNA
jgi:PAS domain S-box-containing protein